MSETKKQNIFEIADEINQIAEAFDLLENGEGTDEEVQAAILAYFGDLLDKRDAKLDSYAYRIQQLTDASEVRKADGNRLLSLAKTDANQAKRMKDRLCEFFRSNEIGKIQSPHYKFSVCSNGGIQSLDILEPAFAYAENKKYGRFIQRTDTIAFLWNETLEKHIPSETVTTYAWDEDAIRSELLRLQSEDEENGMLSLGLPFARLVSRGHHVRIK